MRVGIGYDVHQFAPDRNLILGGVKIDYKLGLMGHSDADVLLHAICDSILGAACLGDIGMHFPDNDDSYKDIDSMILLARTKDIIEKKGYTIGNIDATIVCQKPKMSPYIYQMRENISKCLDINIDDVNIKATTTEKLGFEGRSEGISSHSITLLNKKG